MPDIENKPYCKEKDCQELQTLKLEEIKSESNYMKIAEKTKVDITEVVLNVDDEKDTLETRSEQYVNLNESDSNCNTNEIILFNNFDDIDPLIDDVSQPVPQLIFQESSKDPSKDKDVVKEVFADSGLQIFSTEKASEQGVDLHQEVVYTCDQCIYKGKTKQKLKVHREIHHEGIRYNCEHCDDHEAPTRNHLALHYRRKHKGFELPLMIEKSKVEHNCKEKNCEAKFLHSPRPKQQTTKCDQCDYTGSSKQKVQVHVDIHHRGLRYICDLCKHKTTMKGNLSLHYSLKHKEVPIPPKFEKTVIEHNCKELNCRDKFRNAQEQRQDVNAKLQTNECDQCEYTGENKQNTKNHIDIHHKGIRYNCGLCDRKATSKGNLSSHYTSKHEGVKMPKNVTKSIVEHNCKEENCKAKFPSSRNGKKVEDFYQCEKCPFRSKDQGKVKQHANVEHIGVRFECDQCGSKFRHKMSMKTHVENIHNGVRFNCELCDYKGKSKFRLKEHMQSQHEGLRYKCEHCDFITK